MNNHALAARQLGLSLESGSLRASKKNQGTTACVVLKRRMHHTTFSLKRAHHVTLKVLRPIAAKHDLTPARFDVLNILLLRDLHPQVMPFQAAIARALGLCRSTICKMVKALEKGGFVKRGVAMWGDQRCQHVKLTPYGRRCLLRVLKAIRAREVDRPLLRSLSRFWSDSHEKRATFLRELTNHAQRLRLALTGDFEPNFYPIR